MDKLARRFEYFWFYSTKKAPAAATMATKPWPTTNMLAAPLKPDGAGADEEPPGLLVTAGVVTTPGAVPVAIVDEFPMGYGVATADEDGVDAADEVEATDDMLIGPEVWAVMATRLILEVVATWESVLSPAAEINEVGALATDPVAAQGKVSMKTGKHCAPWLWE